MNRSLFLARTTVEALWCVYQCTRDMYIHSQIQTVLFINAYLGDFDQSFASFPSESLLHGGDDSSESVCCFLRGLSPYFRHMDNLKSMKFLIFQNLSSKTWLTLPQTTCNRGQPPYMRGCVRRISGESVPWGSNPLQQAKRNASLDEMRVSCENEDRNVLISFIFDSG